MSDETQPQLQLQDLVFMLQALQTVSQRGAFRVEEFKAVGECYERIFNFLAANGAIKAATQPTADPNGQQ